MIFALKIAENNQERQPDYFHDKQVGTYPITKLGQHLMLYSCLSFIV